VGRFIKGDIVILPFPFSDLSGSKRRPAFVVADLPGDDIILCQITSKAKSDEFAVAVTQEDFITGSLPLDSFVRPNKLFTADKDLILSVTGHVSDAKTDAVINAVITILSYSFCRYLTRSAFQLEWGPAAVRPSP
jgi:mRNA interferase MazF